MIGIDNRVFGNGALFPERAHGIVGQRNTTQSRGVGPCA